MQRRDAKVITHKAKLERWIVFHDALVGYIFDSPQHPPGTRVITEPLRWIDPINGEADCHTEHYKLGEPGTQEEHNRPLISANSSKIVLG